jgi:hypothetical protein
MNLGADMMGDQPDDALAIGGDSRSPVSASPSESRSIQSRPSGLSITSTTAGSSRNRGDRRPERGAQHARAARCCFGPDRDNAHIQPHVWLGQMRPAQRG